MHTWDEKSHNPRRFSQIFGLCHLHDELECQILARLKLRRWWASQFIFIPSANSSSSLNLTHSVFTYHMILFDFCSENFAYNSISHQGYDANYNFSTVIAFLLRSVLFVFFFFKVKNVLWPSFHIINVIKSFPTSL